MMIQKCSVAHEYQHEKKKQKCKRMYDHHRSVSASKYATRNAKLLLIEKNAKIA